MEWIKKIMAGYHSVSKALDWSSPIFDLSIRCYVGWVFLNSGLLKIQSWETTVSLFENLYQVPVLPPEIAAYLGTAAELGLPVLLICGLATRFGAFALFIFNIIAVVSYPDLSDVGVRDHILWGALLLVPFFHGPGKLSADNFLCCFLNKK